MLPDIEGKIPVNQVAFFHCHFFQIRSKPSCRPGQMMRRTAVAAAADGPAGAAVGGATRAATAHASQTGEGAGPEPVSANTTLFAAVIFKI